MSLDLMATCPIKHLLIYFIYGIIFVFEKRVNLLRDNKVILT